MKLENIVENLVTYLNSSLTDQSVICATFNYTNINKPITKPHIAVSLLNVKELYNKETSFDIELSCYLPESYINIYEYLAKVSNIMQNWEIKYTQISMKKIDKQKNIQATQYSIIVNYSNVLLNENSEDNTTTGIIKYKNYSFNGHTKYNITYNKDVRVMQHIDSENGALLQAVGYHQRVIKGSGILTGESMWPSYVRLADEYYSQISGFLFITALEPINAHFKSLKLVESLPGAIHYEFEFWEDPSTIYPQSGSTTWTTLSDDETLWFISEVSRVSIEKLLLCNPNITTTGVLPKDLVVYLR